MGKHIKIPFITVISVIGLIIIEPSVYLLMIFAAIALHEAGHIAVMCILGVKIKSVTFLPIGIDIKREQNLISYPKDILISIAGAAVNLSIFFIFRKNDFFACVNLLYATINLMPIKGLDGGYAAEAFLLCFFEPCRAEKIMKAVSLCFCILLWAAGIYVLLILNGNISIFALAVFLFTSVIMKK